ncbi:hypothetical protein ACFVRB_41830 [Streptomyces nojiriensis]|uniref:hypothetical protein n=1 Tax=Streptomyces nojiriensis TaxID=66374 RepID=UPI0036DD1247
MRRTTIQWVVQNESALKAAHSDLDLRGKAFPDALLMDRWLLPQFLKALIIEAVKRDAPEGVVEDLLPVYRKMSRGAAEITDYLVDVLAQLEGLRDEHEIAPVLEQARDKAPDKLSREKLERGLNKMRNPLSFKSLLALSDEEFEKLREDSGPGGTCFTCCLGGCSACWPSECSLCCFVACAIC